MKKDLNDDIYEKGSEFTFMTNIALIRSDISWANQIRAEFITGNFGHCRHPSSYQIE